MDELDVLPIFLFVYWDLFLIVFYCLSEKWEMWQSSVVCLGCAEWINLIG